MALHIDSRPDGHFALFIDGDLQFDSSDEALYHEGLALPALCLASVRRPTSLQEDPLRVLICGGGDGLALRECLRFPGVGVVDLVDCSPDVVEFGRTQLSEINGNSISDPRVTVHIKDAWEFLGAAFPYDVVLCDFTVPRQAEDTRVFTAEWYARVREALTQHGVAAINAISPQARPHAFWCLRNTIRAAHLSALPYRVCIPSFRTQGYGPWAFFLASRQPLSRLDLAELQCPVATRQLDLSQLSRAARFTAAEFAAAASAAVHSLASPCLLGLLLSPQTDRFGAKAPAGSQQPKLPRERMTLTDDSLGADNDRVAGPPLNSYDNTNTDATRPANEPFDLQSLFDTIPISHAYQTREMVEALAEQLTGSVNALDIRKLVDALLERAAKLPAAFLSELCRLKEFLRSHAPRLDKFGAWTVKLYATLIILLTLANAIAPDSAFGKGSFGIGHVSISRGYSSFGGRTGFSSEGRGMGGSFEGSTGGRGSFGAFEPGEGFGGKRGFGTSNSAFTTSTENLRGSGFRSSYGRTRTTDIYGYEHEPRIYNYYSYGNSGYHGNGAYSGYSGSGAYGGGGSGGGRGVSTPPNATPTQHKAVFVADDDLLVLENGDVVVTLADSAYLLVSGGTVSLMSPKSPKPILPIYADPAMMKNIAADLQGQQIMASQQIRLRKDWLSWVGWTSALFQQTKTDRLELENLQDLEHKLSTALSRMGSPADDASPTQAPKGSVELFAGCLLGPEGFVAIREPKGWVYTNGTSLWADATASPAQTHNCPPELTAALRAVLTKLESELAGDRAAAQDNLKQLQLDRLSLENDLRDYTNLYTQNGNDGNYEVDYGTDTMSVSEALSRTNNDLQQNQTDTDQAQQQLENSDGEHIAQALQSFGR